MEKNIAKAIKTVTATIGAENYKTTLQTQHHQLLADEPEQIGGKNLGPGPSDFLMSSLAACTAITLKMYVDRKQWVTGEIKVQVCFEHKNENGHLSSVFTRIVSVSQQLDEEKMQRLLDIANACPIHNLLTNPIDIHTTIQLYGQD
ncbi:OsmC family protein [Solitalea sp. MAHUQ-68]|uniref:OsmC family protein n=1 Tax=Solitalea agri TaxID=2953739 RepID=A0A9X2JCY7_9SPHI|nr:OsmC family protein [Solitalea agri]MCO4292300.1 OsmC family protein [Solitalea agri]